MNNHPCSTAVLRDGHVWYDEEDELWTIHVAADLDEDGTHQLVVKTVDNRKPDDLLIVRRTDQVTHDNYTIWEQVNEEQI